MYNVETYLPDFFVSVAEQTYQGFRLVMVDDASTDGTYEIASYLGEPLGDRFVMLQNPENLGASGAKNTGLDWAEKHPTEYITFLDPDDWFEPAYLDDLHEAAKTYGSDLSVSGIIRYDDDTGKVLATEMVSYTDELVEDSSACNDLAFINPCPYAKLYRFNGISSLRFREMKRSEDTCYLFEALPELKSVKFTNNALYHYRVRRDSLTGGFGYDCYASMHEQFTKLLPKFQSGSHAKYREMFECQVFIRSSIGGVTRLAFGDMKHAMSLARQELAWLDSSMPEWRRNKYLSFGRQKSATKKQFALKLSAYLYRAHMFPLFVYLYFFISNVMKKEVRA